MRNVRLTIEYDGSKFSGWQKQSGKRTIQKELEDAFLRMLGEKVTVEGSGRTDKGVHALAQIASVQFEKPIPIKNIKEALNDQLPEDIRIKRVQSAPENFHARFSAKKKTYRYVVVIGQKSAIESSFVGSYPYEVDLNLMKQATRLFVGKHNFKGFCSANAQVTNFEREVYELNVTKRGQKYIFEISGNGFLYNMVRIIVGTLLEVGSKRIAIDRVKNALKTGQRKYAGKTMEPNGLYLKKVEYN